ncbi:rho-associated protein kinase 1-like [Ischnura elegans]|uniref:rho-associated protein kinase 1-like n=1 Tax=Ischnura elegans TaxID=197161 RepID=UPI001ED8B116|nr:rho-associated protein kinase 1-like [Ischnura elegans]XP_046399429.1 rho-associated protein kinase 1-like [Ischnura elegans]
MMNRGDFQWNKFEDRVKYTSLQFAKDNQHNGTKLLDYCEPSLHGEVNVANLEEKFNLLLTDFQFNLQVLKERDKALDLCEAKLEENHAALFKKDALISDLKVSLDQLEAKVSQLNGEKALQQQHHENLVALKDSQLKDAFRNMEHIQEKAKQEIVKKELLFKQQLMTINSLNQHKLLEAKKEFGKKIEDVRESYQKEFQMKVKELDSKEAEISDLKQENEWMATQVSSLKEKILLHRSSKAMLEQKHAQKIKNLEDTIAEKNILVLKEMEDMKKRYEILLNTPCMKCKNLESEIKKLTEEEALFQEELKELKQNYDKVTEEKNAKIEEVEKQLSEAHEVIRNLDERNSALEREIKAIKDTAENDYSGIGRPKGPLDSNTGTAPNRAHTTPKESQINSDGHYEMKPAASQTSMLLKTQEETTQTVPPENNCIPIQSAIHSRNLNHLKHLQDILRARAKQLVSSLSESAECDDFLATSSLSHHSNLMVGRDRNFAAVNKERVHHFHDKRSCDRSHSNFERKLNDLETLVEKLKASMMASIRCKLKDENASKYNKGEWY